MSHVESTEYLLRLMAIQRGQLIAKLGKRIHAQRETISKLQGDRDAIGSRLDAFIEQAKNDSHTMAAARHQIKALLETVAKLKDIIHDLNNEVAGLRSTVSNLEILHHLVGVDDPPVTDKL